MVSELMHWADEDGDAALSLAEFCRLQQQVCHHLRRNAFPFLLVGVKRLSYCATCVCFHCSADVTRVG